MDRPTYPLSGFPNRDEADRIAGAVSFLEAIRTRRTVRTFKPDPIPMAAIDAAVQAAGLAPNGANRQPWHFAIVTSPEIKRQIRKAAEEEERAFYGGRAPQEWLDALAPLGTDWRKPFLEPAPVLIVVFQQAYGVAPTVHARKTTICWKASALPAAFSWRHCIKRGSRR